MCIYILHLYFYIFVYTLFFFLLFSGGSVGEVSACSTGDRDSIPGSGRFPGEGNGNPLQYSCLENSMDRGAWQDIVHEVTESGTTESTNTHTQEFIHRNGLIQSSKTMVLSVPSLYHP